MNDYQINSQQITHPGEVLLGMLEDYSLSQSVLARRLDVSEKHLSNLINGHSSVTTEMAQKLSLVFSTSTDFWLNLQKNYDIIKARITLEEQYEQEKELMSEYTCYKELSDIGYIPYSRKPFEKYVNLLNFFGVAKLSLIETNYFVAFRNVAASPNVTNVAAWLRCGEIDFNKKQEHKEFNYVKFKNSLPRIRQLTAENPSSAFSELVKICDDSGVTIAYTPYISKTGLKGATRWILGKPFIQLSEMHKRADAVWFSFFHEAAHIILMHSKKRNFIDWKDNVASKDECEQDADAFARDILIPKDKYEVFISEGNFGPSHIKSFANQISVGVDIVAGRLVYEEKITPQLGSKFIRGVKITNG